MEVTTILTGLNGSPLLMHNVRLADPSDPVTIEIKALTDMKPATNEIRERINRLCFLGGLYGNGSGPVLPSANVRKSFIEAARGMKLGKNVQRALIPLRSEVPLEYNGPRDAEELWQSGKFVDRAMVTVDRSRVPRVRPSFRGWSATIDWDLDTEQMDLATFAKIANRAGIGVGICDNRTNGYGRFRVDIPELSKVKPEVKS